MKAKKSKKLPDDRSMINVKKKTKLKVEKFIVGTDFTIGSFYTIAAEEKLKRDSK